METKFKLFSLNVEGGKHLHRWVPVVKRLAPDVICLQEVMAEQLPRIEAELGAKAWFAADCSIHGSAARKFRASGEKGVAILSRHDVVQCHKVRYTEQHWTSSYTADSELDHYLPTARHLLVAQVKIADTMFNIGNVHFTWSMHGINSIEQQRDLQQLLAKASLFKDLVLAGDFNIPRATPLFQKLLQHYQSWVPERYLSSLDPNLFRNNEVNLVVDHLLSSDSVRFAAVRYLHGLSDHKGIVAIGSKQLPANTTVMPMAVAA